MRNPLYVGNFHYGAGFAIAFTGKNSFGKQAALAGGSLAAMAGVYSTIVPHEEEFLHAEFGEAFERYCDRVPPFVPLSEPAPDGAGTWNPQVIRDAETRTFVTFGAMLATLVLKSLRT